MTGYFKPFEGTNASTASYYGQDNGAESSVHEAAAWRLANQMGPPWSEIVPPVVVREVYGELGSFALERPGKPVNPTPWNTGEWREAAFFDALVGQQDRHPGNYLVAGDRLTLIDHGFTFARPQDRRGASFLLGIRDQVDKGLTYQERQVLQRVVDSPDLMGLQKMLAPARASALRGRVERMLASGSLQTEF